MFDFDPKRLQFLMDQAEMSQTELASRLAQLYPEKKPKPSLINNWLRRGQQPRFDYVTRLAYIFNVQPGFFAGQKGKGVA